MRLSDSAMAPGYLKACHSGMMIKREKQCLIWSVLDCVTETASVRALGSVSLIATAKSLMFH